MDRLRVDFYVNSRRNSLMTRELLALLNLFNLHKIPAVPFKGPVLATSIYGDVALRQFGDLDLLVRKQDASKAKELLLSLGYKLYNPCTDGDAHREPTCTVVRNGIINVDLHWGLTRSYVPFPIELEDLQDRLDPVDLVGATVSSLSPEDLLLLLTMHGSRHLWDHLMWICDVAELLRVHQGMDWRWVMEQSRMLGSERMLFLGLLLATDLLGATIPEEVMQRVRADPALKSLACQVQERLFAEAEEPHGVVKRFVFRTRVRERLRDKVSSVLYLIRRAVTPTKKDRMVIRVPVLLYYFYYLIRPIRLFRDYFLSRSQR